MTTRLVCADCGSSETNAISAWLGKNGLVRQETSFPSFVTMGRPEQYASLDGSQIEAAHHVKLHNPDKIYTVGQKENQGLVVGKERLINGNRTALLHHALNEMGVQKTDKLILAVGIPTELAYKDDELGGKEQDVVFLHEVAESFKRLPHQILSVKVYPEATPPAYTYYADYNLARWGTARADRLNEGQKTLFVDIGGDTTDFQMVVVMRGLNGRMQPKFNLSTCKSSPGHGVRGMHSLLNSKVCAAFAEQGQPVGGGNLNQFQLEAALNGSVTINNTPVDTVDMVKEAIEEQAARIQTLLTTAIGHLNADYVVFSGGGSAGIFKPYVETWFKSYELSDEWGCAKGLLTLAAKEALRLAQERRPNQKMTFAMALKVLTQ